MPHFIMYYCLHLQRVHKVNGVEIRYKNNHIKAQIGHVNYFISKTKQRYF